MNDKVKTLVYELFPKLHSCPTSSRFQELDILRSQKSSVELCDQRFIKKCLYSLFILLFMTLLVSCEKKPIKIGFIGDLSSKNSQLAIDARNAVEFYIKKVNSEGGVNGRKLIFVVKDDHADADIALEMHQEFIDEGVQFVVGHMHSNMKDSMITSNSEKLLFISPSMGTNTLTDMDDYILRTAPLNIAQADVFYEYYKEQQLDELVVVYDLMNKEYTECLADEIRLRAEHDRVVIKKFIAYDSRTDNLGDVLNQINAVKPNNLLLIAQSTDSAFFVQGAKQKNEKVNIFSVSWSMTKDFIINGGKYAEGTKFIGVYSPDEQTEQYALFEEEFEKIYNYKPSFICVLGADAFNVLLEGLKQANSIAPVDVKKAIVEIKHFSGLKQDFTMNEFGDNDIGYMFFELKQDEFIPMR